MPWINIQGLIHYFVERCKNENFLLWFGAKLQERENNFWKYATAFIYLFSQRFVGLLAKSVGFVLHDMPYFFICN